MNRMQVCIVALVVLALPIGALAGHVSLEPEESVSVKSAVEKPVSSFALKFDLSEVGKGKHVDMATLKLTFDADEELGKSVDILVYVSSEQWEESLLARTSKVGTIDTLMTSSFALTGDEKEAEFIVTEMVQAWYEGKVANNGFVVSVSGNSDLKFEMANKAGQWGASLEVLFSRAE